jgi:fluoride exporter
VAGSSAANASRSRRRRGPPVSTGSLPARGASGPTGRGANGARAQASMRISAGQARIAVIAAGGLIGTLARAGLAEALPPRAGHWPWATFVVNLGGAFILGWLLTRLAERTAPSRHWRFFAGTGFCGALTTFSTFQIETLNFVRDGDVGLAIAYPLVSIAAGMALAVGGVLVSRWGRRW